MAVRPCLQLVKAESPILQCSACNAMFRPEADSLRAMLKEFRKHVHIMHPAEDIIPHPDVAQSVKS